MKKAAIAGIVLMGALSAYGSGMLVPKDASLGPMAIKHQRVNIRIKDGVATARIEQVFKNSVNRDLEATYLFPLPANAAIADFAMYINGKRMSGELVEKDKARKIYEDIVRRMKDPGLLEHMGGQLFRIRVYPVPRNGEQKIELEYSQTLAFESGLYKFVYPLKTGGRASRTLEDFTVSADLSSSIPLKNIYSPSHKVGISRKGENRAIIGFEQEQALLDKDFVLYYGVSKKEFGLNLLTRAVKGEDGHFMMMLSPRVMPKGATIIKKDICFVLDTSGSMSGKKMDQARKALEYCVRKLNDGDRFNIIRFSTDIEGFKEELVTMNKRTRTEALAFVADLEARGGTAIDEALATALSMKYDAKRPSIIAFLTDGRPTIGESDSDLIVSNVSKANKHDARIFVFGVGEQVNTHLLDKISSGQGGLSQYVAPDEDIEVKLSSFSDKMSYPVLANLEVTVDKLKVMQMHPRNLPDLFAGDQITLFGRYQGDGHVAIRLTGQVNGKKREYVYEGFFPETTIENEFIPRLWATRRVGYLLDEIRLHGENKELKNEVLLLSREYGIMTPYTSYLVLETEKAYRDHGIDRPRPPRRSAPVAKTSSRAWGFSRRRQGISSGESREAEEVTVPVFSAPAFTADAEGADALVAPSLSSVSRSRIVKAKKDEVNQYMQAESGKEAVDLSRAIQDYKSRDRVEDDISTMKHVGDKIFLLIAGSWVDQDYKKNMKTLRVTFASAEYFKLLRDRPELKQYLSLGEKVTVVIDEKTAVVVE